MAKIIKISKYPPLEGGIAAKTFWLCHALAERGHTIHVITDREVIAPEYTIPNYSNEFEHKNVFVHRPSNEVPWHIPNVPDRTLDLLDLTIQVIEDCGADVIDTGYLVPYGLIGYFAGKITGLPFVLRHGSSDIEKFYKNGIWNNILEKAFRASSTIITSQNNFHDFKNFSPNIRTLPPYIPNPNYFKSEPAFVESQPTLAIIGKANYYWQHKGWDRMIEIIKCLGSQFRYLFMVQGIGLDNFKKHVEEETDLDIHWEHFVHPFKMPDILNSISGIFLFELDLPFLTFSNLFIEAIYCGVPVITDRNDIIPHYIKQDVNLNINSMNIIVVPGDAPEVGAKIIIDRYAGKGEKRKENLVSKEEDFEAYIVKNEKILSLLN